MLVGKQIGEPGPDDEALHQRIRRGMPVEVDRTGGRGAGPVLFGTTALADTKPTDAEVTKIKEAIAAWGCEGGTYEKETEASGIFEAEDAKCKGGQYDIRLDKDFDVVAITRD